MLPTQCRLNEADAERVELSRGRQQTFMMASSLRLSVSVTRSMAPLKEITRGLSTASKMICTGRRQETLLLTVTRLCHEARTQELMSCMTSALL